MDQKGLVFSDVQTQLYQTIGPTYVRRHLPGKTDLNDAVGYTAVAWSTGGYRYYRTNINIDLHVFKTCLSSDNLNSLAN